MGVVTFTEEFTSPISAQRLFKALILDGDNLIAKIIPQAIKSVETIEGDGGPGSIKQMNFAEGISVKHRIDTLDKENMSYAYTVIEGDALTDGIESISYEVKLDTSPDGGCIGKNISKYQIRPDLEITEELIKDGKEKAAAVFKAVEAYLLANPEACA